MQFFNNGYFKNWNTNLWQKQYIFKSYGFASLFAMFVNMLWQDLHLKIKIIQFITVLTHTEHVCQLKVKSNLQQTQPVNN